MREPRAPSQQLDMMRPVRSCRKLGHAVMLGDRVGIPIHGWDVFGIWMNGRITVVLIKSLTKFKGFEKEVDPRKEPR